jgi:hypothetical protein
LSLERRPLAVRLVLAKLLLLAEFMVLAEFLRWPNFSAAQTFSCRSLPRIARSAIGAMFRKVARQTPGGG